MLPIYLKVKNFTSYIDETIKFEQFGNSFAVIGENGAGKSSIVDMITTCIFYRARGTDSRGSGMDELINANYNRFELEFVFQMNGIEYKIIRKKIREGAHELEFYINGVSHTEKITETQQKINDVIKMDFDTFLDTVCIGQGQSGRFMKKKPNERKDVFIQVLDLKKYEELEKIAKEERKDIINQLDHLETQISLNKNKLSLKDNLIIEKGQIEQNKDELDNELKNLENKLEIELERKNKYTQIKQQTDLILNQRKNLNEKINASKYNLTHLESQIPELKNLINQKELINNLLKEKEDQLENYRQQNSEKISKKSNLETTNNLLLNQAKEYKNKYDQLQNYNQAICNFCGHEITQEYKKSYLLDLMAEGKKYIKQVNDNKNILSELLNEINQIDSQILLLKNEIKDLQSKQMKINSSEIQLNNIKNNIEQTTNVLNEYIKELEENMKIEISEIKLESFNDIVLKNLISDKHKQITNNQARLSVIESKLEEIELAEKDILNINSKIDELNTLKEDYDSIISTYSKSGIPADIIGNAVPEIEQEVNKILDILCHGSISVEFRTQKLTKGKSKAKNPNSIETLEIIVNDKDGSRTYETYSGGEQFRVDFACHVGMSKFLAKRAGATMDFFIVDEGLGSQDEDAKAQFVQSVHQLTKVFKQVMVVTHIEEMKDAFGNKILISKDPSLGSKVTLL